MRRVIDIVAIALAFMLGNALAGFWAGLGVALAVAAYGVACFADGLFTGEADAGPGPLFQGGKPEIK